MAVWLSTSEYADRMGMNQAVVSRRCKQGRQEGARKIGGEWRIPYYEPPCEEEDAESMQSLKESLIETIEEAKRTLALVKNTLLELKEVSE